MSETLSSTFWNNEPHLFLPLVFEQIKVFLKHDSFVQAGLAFCRLGTVAITRYNDLEWGQELTQLSKDLLLRHHSVLTYAKGFTLYALFLEHYYFSLHESLYTLENALDSSFQAGDRVVSLTNLGAMAMLRFSLGQDLRDIERFCVDAPQEFTGWESELRGISTMIVAVRQACRALQGKTMIHSPASIMEDDTHSTPDLVTAVVGKISEPSRILDPYHVAKMIALYHYGFYQEAKEMGEIIHPSLEGVWATRTSIMGIFYYAMSTLALLLNHHADPSFNHHLAHIKACKAKIDLCGRVCNTNYLCWSLLLQAGIHELTDNFVGAIHTYEDALDHAQIHGFALDEAHAWELQAEFLVRRGTKRTARALLQESIAAWNRISATGKAGSITIKHEFLLKTAITTRTNEIGCQTVQMSINPEGDRVQSRNAQTRAWLNPADTALEVTKTTESSNLGLDIIDLSSILESSQVISSELQIERLLAKMVEILLESVAGQADYCAIIIQAESASEWVIAAAGDPEHGVTAYPEGLAFSDAEDQFAQQISHNALRFKEQIMVPQILEDDRFLNVNEAFLAKYPLGRSVVAIPVIQAERVLGVVHLEGGPRAFTQRNMVVLNLLTNQIGISLANAMLFKRIAKVSATNASMVESQRRALAQAREAEHKAKVAEANAMKALAEAREASKAKSLFLANVSHELRTPLNGVIGMSEILKGTKLSNEQEGYTDSIKICADTLLTVINDILDYSKLESGKMGLIQVPVNLTDSITEVVRALAYTNQERGLETFKDLALEPNMLVSADPVRLHQIFMNLLSNAYKFTPRPGKVYVRARVDQEWEKKIQITCEVQDTGIGITKQQLTRLFQPFSQADSSTNRTYGGTGLGLSICKAMIENIMHGTIKLESEPGSGTTVSFTLLFDKIDKDGLEKSNGDPLSRWAQDRGDTVAHPNASFCDLSKVPRDQIKVCIAEDNPINQKIAVSFVSKLGLQSEAFGDGRQAVDALRKQSKEGKPFHLVLMDVQMPVLDGYDATKEIRKDEDPQVRDILVIAMTASAIRGDREKCIDAGMNDYLAKPVRAQVLKSMLENYLSQPSKNIPDLQKTAREMAEKATKEAEKVAAKKRKGSVSSVKKGIRQGLSRLSKSNDSKDSIDRSNTDGVSSSKAESGVVEAAAAASTTTVQDGVSPTEHLNGEQQIPMTPGEAIAKAFEQKIGGSNEPKQDRSLAHRTKEKNETTE